MSKSSLLETGAASEVINTYFENERSSIQPRQKHIKLIYRFYANVKRRRRLDQIRLDLSEKLLLYSYKKTYYLTQRCIQDPVEIVRQRCFEKIAHGKSPLQMSDWVPNLFYVFSLYRFASKLFLLNNELKLYTTPLNLCKFPLKKCSARIRPSRKFIFTKCLQKYDSSVQLVLYTFEIHAFFSKQLHFWCEHQGCLAYLRFQSQKLLGSCLAISKILVLRNLSLTLAVNGYYIILNCKEHFLLEQL